jgi:hypothetical protein
VSASCRTLGQLDDCGRARLRRTWRLLSASAPTRRLGLHMCCDAAVPNVLRELANTDDRRSSPVFPPTSPLTTSTLFPRACSGILVRHIASPALRPRERSISDDTDHGSPRQEHGRGEVMMNIQSV